jgi:DNA-3-methyladenine glycosylase
MKPLPLSFFARDTVQVAQELLGKIIEINGIKARIVETEAYKKDPASHAYTKTERSQIMYETHGHIYIYLIYGMYHCLNFTTEKDDAGAVLIRAVEPLNNIHLLQKRRNTTKITNLCSGPGKLCQALSLSKNHNAQPIGKEIHVYDDNFNPTSIAKSPRIGISIGTELEWRFYIKDNPFVSKR